MYIEIDFPKPQQNDRDKWFTGNCWNQKFYWIYILEEYVNNLKQLNAAQQK